MQIWSETVSCFFISSRRRHTRRTGDWSSDVCSSDLNSGARSSGPMGFSVPGCSTGARGLGRSGRMLHQACGMRLCGRLYWMESMGYILLGASLLGMRPWVAIPGIVQQRFIGEAFQERDEVCAILRGHLKSVDQRVLVGIIAPHAGK